MDLRDGKVFCGSTDPVSVGQRLVAKRGPVAPAIVGVPRFSLAFGERKAGRGKNAECELRLAIKSRSHRHGAGGELKSTPFELARWGLYEFCRPIRRKGNSLISSSKSLG